MWGRLADRTAVRIALYAVIALAVVWPMLSHAAAFNEFRDAEVLSMHEQAAVASIRDYGQLPLWNPWYCGGLYGLGEAQSRFAAPPFLLSLLFGVERAQPIIVWLFAVLGMEGTYRWLRLRVNDATAVLRVAPIFALSGHFAVAWFRGWTNFFGFELVPFVLYGITVAARGRTHGIAVAAIAFAIILGFGGTFAAPLIAVAAVAETLRVLLETPPGRRLRAIAMLFSVASFMAAVAAVRLLPLAEVLSAQPRIMAGTPGHPPIAILYFLVKSINAHAGELDEPNGAFYVGGGFLALIALGGAERKSMRPLVIVILFLWLSAGYARKPALFALLRELPVFSALRYPERFLWLGILFACEPAANALAKVPRLGEGKGWRNGANIVLSAAVLLSVGWQVKAFWDCSLERDLGAVSKEPGHEFRQSRGNRWLAGHYQGLNLGSLSCWETHPVTMSPNLRGDLAQEEYIENPALGAARRVSWSPNVLVVHTKMSAPGRLFINQNWHPGWRASVGNVVSVDGLLAVELPAGEHDVRLAFEPRSAFAGGVVTLVGLASLLGLAFVRVPFRRGAVIRTAVLVLAPWAAMAALVATWKEPRFPPPPMRNQNNSPALVSAVAPDAVPIAAQFELPIVLDAAKVEGPHELYHNIDIDLWFRRTGPLPRTTGMFVHLIRRPGQEPIPPAEPGKEPKHDFWNVDHQVVGGSFYLSDAPRDIIVHDSFGAHLSHPARGWYDVWVSFGHVSGKKGRTHVIEKGRSEINDDRIKVGSFQVL
jgi:hypothetical protein